MGFKIKRIYEEPESSDGLRILVDRLWPRGISKERAQLAEWLKDISPSPSLRKDFNHKPDKFESFTQAYLNELKTHPEKLQATNHLLELMKSETITLLYGAKDPVHNHAVVLQHYLEENMD